MNPTAIQAHCSCQFDQSLEPKIAQLDLLVKQHYPTYVEQIQSQIKKCAAHIQALFTSAESRNIILRAIELAILEQRHLFQKDGTPIIIHELEAASLLAESSEIRDADVFVAAILHHGQFDRYINHDGNFFNHADLHCIERHFGKRASEILVEFDSLPLFNTPEGRESVIGGAVNLSPAVQNLWLADRMSHPNLSQESRLATCRLLDAMTGADQKLKEACRTKLAA